MNIIKSKKVCQLMGSWTTVESYGDYKTASECILVIPGNPGLIKFYDDYLLHLHKLLKLPTVGVSHGGHLPALEYSGTCNYLTLPDQILHKLEFIKEKLSSNTKLILIGHSVGCYIILKMLTHKFVSNRLTKALLLFPTIEHISKTPNGEFWTPVSNYCRLPIACTTYMASFLPFSVKNFLVSWRTKWRELPDHLLEACYSCFGFHVVNHALYMAASEMNLLNEFDEDTIKVIHEHNEKIIYYYGQSDRWVPHDFYETMKCRFPDANIVLCEQGYQHDFVLDSPVDMAETSAKILTQ